jgi:hypothetical protein
LAKECDLEAPHRIRCDGFPDFQALRQTRNKRSADGILKGCIHLTELRKRKWANCRFFIYQQVTLLSLPRIERRWRRKMMNNRRNRMKKTRWRKWWNVGDVM